MQVLLIDNYDSYTYNLYQLLAAVVGREPVVMVNDDPRLKRLDGAQFAAAVISPGPGRPQHPADLGWCVDMLSANPGLPVLGVCLGHQAIAYHSGAQVRPGVPRHGYLTEVEHEGTELFDGIPTGFRAVRYHSLHVPEPLPDDLQATAWAPDGTVMALRHRRRPWWGVQFHPESVATEYGAELLGNFAKLAATAGHEPIAASAPSSPGETGETAAEPVGARRLSPVVTVLDHAVDAERAFGELFAAADHAYWLDSSLAEPGRSRFSFLGDATGPLAEILTYRTGTGVVRVDHRGRTRYEAGTIFDVLERRLAATTLTDVDVPFDLTGGYVGYFGYEAKNDCGGAAVHRADTPDAMWLFADRLIAVDHREDRTYVLAVAEPGGRGPARRWVDGVAERIRRLPAPAASAPRPVTSPAAPAVGAQLSRGRERYLADIESCLAELRAGESYEICLTNRVRLPPVDDTLAYYAALRRVNPAPYAAYLRLGEFTVLSSSPERFIRIDRDRVVESQPIKGTAPRDADPAADEALRASLSTSAKTRAENLMIVDLLRNDLGKVCQTGSVTVPSFLATESYATVHQLVSTVRGRLRPRVGPVECVRACFPGGSMTGAPKIRTMEIIDRLEGEARGVYSGALGYFGLGGAADLSIVIRTAVATSSAMTAGTGGAIVLDSDPADEFAETMLKMRALVCAHAEVTRQPS